MLGLVPPQQRATFARFAAGIRPNSRLSDDACECVGLAPRAAHLEDVCDARRLARGELAARRQLQLEAALRRQARPRVRDQQRARGEGLQADRARDHDAAGADALPAVIQIVQPRVGAESPAHRPPLVARRRHVETIIATWGRSA